MFHKYFAVALQCSRHYLRHCARDSMPYVPACMMMDCGCGSTKALPLAPGLALELTLCHVIIYYHVHIYSFIYDGPCEYNVMAPKCPISKAGGRGEFACMHDGHHERAWTWFGNGPNSFIGSFVSIDQIRTQWSSPAQAIRPSDGSTAKPFTLVSSAMEQRTKFTKIWFLCP